MQYIFVGFKHFVPRIWPKLRLIDCVKSGPFATYTKMLQEKYTGGACQKSKLKKLLLNNTCRYFNL